MKNKLFNMIKNPNKFLYSLASRGYLDFLSDKTYLKIFYSARMDRKLDLDNPITFNEKIQWLKLYDRKPEYPKLVDKYLVRNYVKDTIGEEYLIPLLGVWNSFDEIDFSKLPNQFVLKTTHDSGGVFICKDKSKFNFEEAKQLINKSLSRNYFYRFREWVYKDVTPRIIAEKFMVKNDGNGLDDYKFFCFNGEVKAMFVATERSTNVKFDFFDPDFNRLPLKQHYPNSNKNLKKPKNLNDMLEIAKILSKDMPHVRVDLYNDNGKIYFGEMTFYHFSGARKFEPEKYDEIFGSWIDLSSIKHY